MRSLAVIALAAAPALLLVASCTLPGPSVQAAGSDRRVSVRRDPPGSIWPERLPATTPRYEVRRGAPPTDLGVYARCHVLQLSAGRRDPLLFFSSRTRERLYEPRGHLKVSLKADQNLTRFVTRDHRMTLVELEPASTPAARGTVIYLASIMGLPPQEQAFLRRLRRAGWNVAACLPSLELFYRDGWPRLEGGGDLTKAARHLAERIDGHLAERAYAVEALLEYLAEERPAWLEVPRVAIGSSAGAIALPAVVARIGEVDAAVLIGGGAHVPRIIMDSWLGIYKPVLHVEAPQPGAGRNPHQTTRPLTPRERRLLKEQAFRKSRLDPAHLGSVLNGTPTLLVSARHDGIVPAETGDLLYEALHRPERWTYPVGHVILFLGLPSQAGKVAAWLDQHAVAR